MTDTLYAKIGRSGRQTMVLFVSINGWSDNVVTLLKQNTDKPILLMNGNDLQAVLEGKIALDCLLKSKTRALNVEAEPFRGADEIIQSLSKH